MFTFVACYNTELIYFRLARTLFESIHQKAKELDAAIFQEQITTGLFNGNLPIPEHLLDHMREMAENGVVRPYFGATSATGQGGDEIVIHRDFAILQSKHSASKEPTRIKIPQEDIFLIGRSDSMGVNPSKLDPNYFQFNIKGKEFETLHQWEHWRPEEAFTERYTYHFSGSTLGMAVNVKDRHQQIEIDITDYDDW